MDEPEGVPFSTKIEDAGTNIHFRPQERSTSMKNIISILLVVFVFAVVGLMAQEQATTSPSAAPSVANPTVAASSGVAAEPVATSADWRLEGKVSTTPEKAAEPRAKGRADSEEKPVPEGDPNAPQNLIEYGGPG